MNPVGLKYGTDLVVDSCQAAWTEYTNGSITSTLSSPGKVGASCVYLHQTGGGAITGAVRLATHAIGSINLSIYFGIQFYLYSSRTWNAGDLALLLDDTAACVSPLETIPLPALAANAWNLFIIPLPNHGSDTAIISIGLQLTAQGTMQPGDQIFLDAVKAVNGTTFLHYGGRGVDDVDDVRPWPAVTQTDLAGGLHQNISSFARVISLTLAPAGNLSLKAWRAWLLYTWAKSNSMHIVYNGEDIPVVFHDVQTALKSIWMGNTDQTRGYPLVLDEATCQTSTPDAMLATWPA